MSGKAVVLAGELYRESTRKGMSVNKAEHPNLCFRGQKEVRMRPGAIGGGE